MITAFSVLPFLVVERERAGEQRVVLTHGALYKGHLQSSSLGPSLALA